MVVLCWYRRPALIGSQHHVTLDNLQSAVTKAYPITSLDTELCFYIELSGPVKGNVTLCVTLFSHFILNIDSCFMQMMQYPRCMKLFRSILCRTSVLFQSFLRKRKRNCYGFCRSRLKKFFPNKLICSRVVAN